MYYVYVLRCNDNSLYTGITTDPQRRFNEHKNKTPQGAKYTRSRDVIDMVGLWRCDSKITASKFEFHFKRLPKIYKEDILKAPEKISLHLKEKVKIEKCVWIKDRYDVIN